ncbi:MAG: EamA family transporter [Chloroflexi bacterium]|nr:EamA family transporter [Chloroflexota bacterium]
MKGKRVFAYTLVFASVLLAAGGQIAMKTGMKQVGEIGSIGHLLDINTVIRIFTAPGVIAGISLYGISLFFWLGALSTLNVSVVYPLVSLAYVVTAVIAFLFLKESITLLQAMGILLIVGGCFLIIRAGT